METDPGDNSGLHDNNLPSSEDKAVHEEEEQQEEALEVSEDVRAGEERDLHPLCSSTTSQSLMKLLPGVVVFCVFPLNDTFFIFTGLPLKLRPSIFGFGLATFFEEFSFFLATFGTFFTFPPIFPSLFATFFPPAIDWPPVEAPLELSVATTAVPIPTLLLSLNGAFQEGILKERDNRDKWAMVDYCCNSHFMFRISERNGTLLSEVWEHYELNDTFVAINFFANLTSKNFRFHTVLRNIWMKQIKQI